MACGITGWPATSRSKCRTRVATATAACSPPALLREPVERAADCDFRVLNLGVAGEGEAQRESGSANGRYGCRWRRDRCAVARNRCRHSPASACMRWRGSAIPSASSRCCARPGSRWCLHAFPDHHAHTPGDFRVRQQALPILMTEKDAVKCAAFVEAQAYTVPVDAQLPEVF